MCHPPHYYHFHYLKYVSTSEHLINCQQVVASLQQPLTFLCVPNHLDETLCGCAASYQELGRSLAKWPEHTHVCFVVLELNALSLQYVQSFLPSSLTQLSHLLTLMCKNEWQTG